MKAKEIINLVKDIRNKCENKYLTNPFGICQALDIPIRKITLNPKLFPAFTTNVSGNPIISLNDSYSFSTQFVLCAHELGHALLHSNNFYNGFDGENLQQEYEANLFAVSLLFREDQYDLFDVPIYKMSNTDLKYILDKLIESNENFQLYCQQHFER